MENKIKQIIGFVLAMVILSTGISYYFLSDNLKIRIDKDKTTFYSKLINETTGQPYGRWLVAGREKYRFLDGSQLINREARNIVRQSIIDEQYNTSLEIRTTPHINGAVINETYFFYGNTKDPEHNPVYHYIEIYNGNTCGVKGCIFEYNAYDLVYDGPTIDVKDKQSFEFGRNMKVEWSEGFYYAKVFQQKESDKLVIKYRITEPYVKLNIRLFDPIVKESPSPSDRVPLLRDFIIKDSKIDKRADEITKVYSNQYEIGGVVLEEIHYVESRQHWTKIVPRRLVG